MAFDVVLDANAVEVLDALPVDVAIEITEQIYETLAEDPLAHGRRAAFPYRPVGQIYQFWCRKDDPPRYVTIFFHYLPGETTIRIYDIGVRTFA